MANFLPKLEELSKKLVEIDNMIYQNTDMNDLNTLRFKNKQHLEQMKNDIQPQSYKEEANDIRQNENQNSDSLFKTQFLNELNEHVHETSFKRYSSNVDINQIDPKNVNEFLLHLKNEIGQVKNDVSSARDAQNNKAHALIKLQTLGTLITCHIINNV